ncbi:MAG: glycosyltransferase [Anaerolineaceae bacterium]|nr:glycosyltransferase [Anaerolineaceae bacterium]
MLKIGMCPNPFYETDWSRTANPNLIWQAEAIEQKGAEIIPLTRKQVQNPALWHTLHLDVVHLHWPAAVFNFIIRRKQIQMVLPQMFVVKWAERILKKWEKDVLKSGIPIVWQVHDILSHHAVGYNYPADLMMHETIFRSTDGLLLNGAGSLQPVVDFYGIEKPYCVAPLGSYRKLYGEPIPRDEALSRLGISTHGMVFSYLGTARPKRNPAATIEAFLQQANESDVLIIAGNNMNLYVTEQLDQRIKLFSGVIPAKQFHEIICASDFVINDGKKYLTSAIIRAAASYSKPVIAYAYGSAIDMAKNAAIWIDDDHGGLGGAIREASNVKSTEWQKLSDGAALNEKSLTWEENGIASMALYEQVIAARKANGN